MRREPTLSIRLLWPFARVVLITGTALDRVGLSPEDFADPDARISRRLAFEAAAAFQAVSPTMGLRAAEHFEVGDFEVLEYAARSERTLGDALGCLARYHRLIDESTDLVVYTERDQALMEFRLDDPTFQPSVVNDFIVAAALAFSRRNVAVYEPPLEVRLAHEKPSYAEEYEQAFGAPVVYGARFNTIVIRKSRLSVPMQRPNPVLAELFERRARRLLDDLRKGRDVSGRVREELTKSLRGGGVSMRETSRRLAMSPATLRRRLQEEHQTFSGILDEARRQLAEYYLSEPRLTVTEISFLLGFRSVAAFGRAFKRWKGLSPVAYRERPALT